MCKKGYKFSDEVKKHMSEAQTGMKRSPEAIEKSASFHRGRKRSDETRKKISEANKGNIVREETKRKLSEVNKGKKLSLEHRAKISKANKGKNRTPEQCEKHRRENNPNWKGGISFEPYCILFNREFKERVRNFFDRKCVECGIDEIKEKHCVHHVNFDKGSCCNNNIPLFVTLCKSCHSKTNYNREYWEERYTKLINEKYGGRCYLPKSESTVTSEESVSA